MAFKQPKVPPMREEERLAEYIRELILFFKDFCLEAWTQSRRQEAQIKALTQEMTALKERLDAQ